MGCLMCCAQSLIGHRAFGANSVCVCRVWHAGRRGQAQTETMRIVLQQTNVSNTHASTSARARHCLKEVLQAGSGMLWHECMHM